MSVSLQRANFWKRISAYLCDFILTVMLAVGFAAAISAIIGYDKNSEAYEAYMLSYEESYGIDLDLSSEEIAALPEEEQALYREADTAFKNDETALAMYTKLFNQSFLILAFGILLSCVGTYFVIPLLFKNGQTLGKKVFGLAVMRTNCVKITPPILFIRSILGLYTIETMLPIVLLLMIYFGVLGFVGALTILALFILQIVVLCVTKTNSSIHDLLSDTVVVDMPSQQIFESEDALIAYMEELHAQEAEKSEYQSPRLNDHN